MQREASWNGVNNRVNGHVRFEEVLDIHKFMDQGNMFSNFTKYVFLLPFNLHFLLAAKVLKVNVIITISYYVQLQGPQQNQIPSH